MSSRNYDFILNVADTSLFVNSNLLIGLSSGTSGLIVNVDHSVSTIKVKLSNTYQEFITGERIISNATIFAQGNATATYVSTGPTSINGNSYTLNGSTNSFSMPSSSLTTFFTDSINVYMDDYLLPKQSWVYSAITAIGNFGVTIKPLVYTKIVETDLSNLRAKAAEVIKSNFFNTATWVPGSSIPDNTLSVNYISTVVDNYSRVIPDVDLQRIFSGSQAQVDAGTKFTFNLPSANISNLKVSLAYGELHSSPFYPGYKLSEIETANTTISSIAFSSFIAEKNAFEQQPLVRLYTLYYPGEWYPPLDSGNPNTEDLSVAYPWPAGFPVRFAEIRGDYISDINYKVNCGGISYTPYPINSTGISMDSTGKINDVTFTVSNFDNMITSLVENSFLCGYNKNNNSPGIVNGEVVFNIDPRTNAANAYFDSSYAQQMGNNVAWTYESTTNIGDEWVPLKQDTRDLLGGVLEIRTTFANLIDFWPEYSTVVEKASATHLRMRTTSPYRIGDTVHNNANDMVNATSVITQIIHPYIVLNDGIAFNPGDHVYIQNPEASSDEFVLDVFKVNNLEGLDDSAAKFSLTSWLQYFKQVSPKRSFLKNSCVWVYGGDECQYPRSGTGTISGSTKSANGFFTITNATTADPNADVCARNDIACRLRNNEKHFSGFPGTGVSLPR